MKIIGISGSSCSGKSTLCAGINAANGSLVISTDDYFKQIDDYVRNEDGSVDFDHPDNILWEELLANLKDLSEGKETDIPVYEKGIGKGRVGHRRVSPTDVIVVEGYMLFTHPEILNLIPRNQRVFLELPVEIQKERRSIVYGGHDNPEYFEQVSKVFQTIIEPTKIHAGEIIDATMSIEEVLNAFLEKFYENSKVKVEFDNSENQM
jgi:uridine kinase